MAWHPPRTWASGEFWTAALVNEELRDNLIALQPVTGELKMFVRQPTSTETVIGTNWLECNGTAVSRANYSLLYALLNGMRTTRGSGTTTVTAAIDTVQTTIPIALYSDAWPGGRADWSTGAWPAHIPFLIQIDSEKMLVTGRGAFPYLTLTVVRAREGTLAASHNLNATVVLGLDLPFGSGDGVTTFNVPDLHGRTPWSAARSGGHADMTYIGKDDLAILSARRARHGHGFESRASGAVGNQMQFAGGTGGAGLVTGYNDGLSGWGWGGGGTFVGPHDEGGGAAFNTVPVNAPGYVVAGVWAIRFVGV